MRVQDFRDAVSVYGPLFTLLSYPLGALGVPAALWSLKAIAGALGRRRSPALTARLARVRGVDPARRRRLRRAQPARSSSTSSAAPTTTALMVLLAMLAGAARVLTRAAGRRRRRDRRRGRGQGGRRRSTRRSRSPAPAGERRLLVGDRGRGGRRRARRARRLRHERARGAQRRRRATRRRSAAGACPATLGADHRDRRRPSCARLRASATRSPSSALLVWAARGGDWVRAAGWAAFGLLVASAYMAPWYLIWLLPLAAISRDRVADRGDRRAHRLPGRQRDRRA